jgi:hypothetical protein
MNRLIAATFLFSTLGAGFASAMPLAPWRRQGAPMSSKSPADAAPGWHRGPYGGCLRNYANPAAHACPRGFHIGP